MGNKFNIRINKESFKKKLDIKDGKTPSESELLDLIKPLLPKKAKDGKAPTKKELMDLIEALIPDFVDTPDELATKLGELKRGWISIDSIKDFPERIGHVIKQFGGGNTRPLDVLVNGNNFGGAREINFVGSGISAEVINGVLTIAVTDSGGGGATIEIPPESPDGVITAFTASAEPQYVVYDGNTYFDGAGYTYSAGTVTTDQPVNLYIRLFI